MALTKKNILFTFDYELYLGKRSGSVDKCCIEPTNQLIQLFDTYGIKNAIFFVDTTCLIRLKENEFQKSKDDFNKISQQIQLLIKKGHYVFPHIHPHWLDATYNSEINQWDLFNNSRYRISRLSEAERAQLFRKSIELLEEIILPIDANYKIDAYRAGGWCIQPFADFIPSFEKHSIKNDFSVLPTKSNTSEIQFYDFTKAPKKNIYSFETDPIQENINGKYKEFAISVVNVPPINQTINKLVLAIAWRLKQRSIGDGVGSVASAQMGKSAEKNQTEMVSVELLTHPRLKLYLNHLKKNDYIHFISHPKMLSNYNLMVLKKFLAKFTSQYAFETDFRKMS